MAFARFLPLVLVSDSSEWDGSMQGQAAKEHCAGRRLVQGFGRAAGREELDQFWAHITVIELQFLNGLS